MRCPVCGVEFVSPGKLYIHQVLTREITVSPYEFTRVERAAREERVARRAVFSPK